MNICECRDLIRNALISSSLSPAQLADIHGAVSKRTIQAWLAGENLGQISMFLSVLESAGAVLTLRFPQGNRV